MNTRTMTVAACIALTTLASCGGSASQAPQSAKKDSAGNAPQATPTAPKKNRTLEPGLTPFDFPTVNTFAKEGDYVLCPSYKMWQDKLAAEDPTRETYIFYTAEMAKPGAVESEIKFTFDGTQKMPNSMLIAIPKGQKAKTGDIVLTWWQTGSGMQRAIVTDASNPAEPTVRYLDLGWDNPAKDSKSGKLIGQTEYKLKPDSFVGLNNFAPGSTIAAKGDGKWNAVQVIRMSNNREKVLTLGFAGKIKVYDGKDCYTIPQKPKVKTGDKVYAVFTGAYTEAIVVRVEERMGLVFVKFPTMGDKETALSFGEVAPILPKL